MVRICLIIMINGLLFSQSKYPADTLLLSKTTPFINKIGISQCALELGVKRSYLENSPLPIVMWSYGLITTSQLEIIFLWLKEN